MSSLAEFHNGDMQLNLEGETTGGSLSLDGDEYAVRVGGLHMALRRALQTNPSADWPDAQAAERGVEKTRLVRPKVWQQNRACEMVSLRFMISSGEAPTAAAAAAFHPTSIGSPIPTVKGTREKPRPVAQPIFCVPR